ncbi:EAL domain-containing protein [Undibacterium jejuense]|uniref:EAL domain-containing protein n=1 Tax=Undibacterium jejuense TaxID=1344949 RepID=A0A923KKL4_9BURK|nr:EAL domain-containing protein [Undibacterium jejuense]MBC3862050.1 EAL domain-containing protein [Undibacterium jejuense]
MHLWLQQGAYNRLFVPLLVLVLAVAGLRYYLLIDAETGLAHQRQQVVLTQTAHYLSTRITELDESGNVTDISRLFEQELGATPELAAIYWSADQQNVESHQQPHASNLTKAETVPKNPPPWFGHLIKLPPLKLQTTVALANGQTGKLRIDANAAPATYLIWKKVQQQLLISSFLLIVVFSLLALVVRANAKTLAQLAAANHRFQHGEYSVRMEVGGTSEGRALSSTFNSMAAEVEQLVTSLRVSQAEQNEQLHFTWQLLTALPIPIFFKDRNGICRGVNAAWTQMFGMSAQHAVGRPMQEILPLIEQISYNLHTQKDAHQGQQLVLEMNVPTADKDLDVIYYEATYTSVEGKPSGVIGALVDISERKQMQADLAEEKERVETTLDSIGDAVISTDIDGRILTLNRVARQLTGWSRDEAQSLLLTEVFELSDPEQQSLFFAFLQNIEWQSSTYQANNQALRCRNGKLLDINFTAAPIRQVDGTHRGCVLIFRDLSEQRQLLRQISWQAGHDILTGLANRSSLTAHFQNAITIARQQNTFLAVCLLDLDHFQAVNEQYGQEFADKLLQRVARRLERSVGEGNLVARLGGDEFVVLLQNQHDLAEVDKNLVLLLAELAQPYQIEQRNTVMSASIGVAIYPRDEQSPDALLRFADQAMYQAKISGRNKYHLFDAQRDQEVRTHHNQRVRISEALYNNEFVLYFQPKVDMRRGLVIGMEALLRWDHPERGILSPMEFLPLIEQTDLIIEVGEWVMRKSLAYLQEWIAAGHQWVISVNIAARHFQCHDFLEKLSEILSAFPQLPSQSLEIEILESAAIQDIQYVHEVMLAAQQLGVRFALDDFGTGYSSLSYLKRLPANTLKIDQSFIRDMLDDQDDLALIGAIIGLARAFKREVIAEGVETTEHGVALMRLGCDLAQGFGIARPMPANQVLAWAQGYLAPTAWRSVVVN